MVITNAAIDLIITSARIFGQKPPQTLSAAVVERCQPDTVIVDLNADIGGNCALTVPGETVVVDGVTIIGHLNMAGRLAVDASALYARNLLAFLSPLLDAESGALKLDWEDEIITATALTRDGAVIHPQFVNGEAR